jgi:hypothetical protein
MNSKDHSEDEFNSLRTYFSKEITENSNNLKKDIMNEMKLEITKNSKDLKQEMNEMKSEMK